LKQRQDLQIYSKSNNPTPGATSTTSSPPWISIRSSSLNLQRRQYKNLSVAQCTHPYRLQRSATTDLLLPSAGEAATVRLSQ
jgi:hypothetical protein